MKKLFLFILLLFLVGCSNKSVPDIPTPLTSSVKESTSFVNVVPESAKVISKIHSVFIEKMCYGKLETYVLSDFKDAKKIIDEFTSCTKDEMDPKLKQDLINAQWAFSYGVRFRNEHAFRIAHRILHDLDYSLFTVNDDDPIYGYSLYLDGKESAKISKEITKFIKKMKN